MRLPLVVLSAALLFPSAAFAHLDECPSTCVELLCSDAQRGAVEAMLTGEAGGASIEASITEVYGVMGTLYQTGDTIQVPADEGFLPGEHVLLIVSSTDVGVILGAARVEDGKVECGQMPEPLEVLQPALQPDCISALGASDMNEPTCGSSAALGSDESSGCAAGGAGGFGLAGLIIAGAALLRRKGA